MVTVAADSVPVLNKFVFFLPCDPRLCNLYPETVLTFGYVQYAVSSPINPTVPGNPWRRFEGQWLQRDFLLGDTLVGDTLAEVLRGGVEVWKESNPGWIQLPSGRVVKFGPPERDSWHQYRQDVFKPAVFFSFEEGLNKTVECLSTMPPLPSQDEDGAVETLAELIHLGMSYDNPRVEEVLGNYLEKVNADPNKKAKLDSCKHLYAFLATLPYRKVRKVVDDCIIAARGKLAGQPRILPEEVPAVADFIRSKISPHWKD